jgi:hypothetical protein
MEENEIRFAHIQYKILLSKNGSVKIIIDISFDQNSVEKSIL